jgi:hypothetical protein
VEIVPRELRVFEPEEEFGTEGGSGYGGGDEGPADRSRDGITEAAAEREIDAEGDEVGESFEEDVRVDGPSPDVEVDWEGCGGEME